MGLIGYARVSTRDQHEESQHDLLTEAGCTQIFTDNVSGKLARRPEWDRCRDYLRAGDTLVVTRLSRSVRHLTEVGLGSSSAASICSCCASTSTPAPRPGG